MITKTNFWKYFKRIVITLLVMAVIAISGTWYIVHTLFGTTDETWRFKLQKFDREKWLISTDYHNDQLNPRKNRAEMIDDLEKNFFKIFMTEEEILSLLGSPDTIKSYYIFYGTIKSNKCLSYVLGIHPVFGLEYVLRFCLLPATKKYIHTIF